MTQKQTQKKEPGNLEKPNKTPANLVQIGKHNLNMLHFEVINNYYSNGYNKSRAVMDAKPSITNHSQANVVFNSIWKHENNQAYIKEKQEEIAFRTDLQASQLVGELLNWTFSDASQYVGLTVDEIKALSPAERRAIQSYSQTTKTRTLKNGTEVKTTETNIKLVDKATAIEKLIKMYGLYSVDNNQKRSLNVTASDLSLEQKKALTPLFKLINDKNKE